jgi:hypothetical protein
MKRMLIVTAVSLLALPLGAEEKQPAKTSKTAKAAPAAKPPAESPLVAAARRARRGSGKSVVITDDTVKNSTGRVTSTTIVYSPTVPKDAPSAEVVHNQQRAKAKADEEKKAAAATDEKKKKDVETARLARLAEEAQQGEDGFGGDVDPAQLERDLAANAAAEKKP